MSQIRGIVKAVEVFTEKTLRALTAELTAQLIERTPVDTGWARANWVPNIGSPFEANLEGVSATRERASQAQVRQGERTAQVVTTYQPQQGSIFVSNNVPYIQELNDGSSTQAPAGFVQQAIAASVRKFQS